MAIAEYLKEKREKGMGDFMNVLKTGLKVGKTVANVATGNWVGAVATWVPDIAKSMGEAMGFFEKWKAGQAAGNVNTASPSYDMDWWKGRT
jgi:hypothetical protein